jgi:thymidylate synthase
MYLSGPTVDDLLRRVLEELLKSKNHDQATRGGFKELTGVLLRLTNPRARLSRSDKKGKLFSSLGEFLWYLARSDNLAFISYYLPKGIYKKYSDDGHTIYGAYDPRLFAMRGQPPLQNRGYFQVGARPSNLRSDSLKIRR